MDTPTILTTADCWTVIREAAGIEETEDKVISSSVKIVAEEDGNIRGTVQYQQKLSKDEKPKRRRVKLNKEQSIQLWQELNKMVDAPPHCLSVKINLEAGYVPELTFTVAGVRKKEAEEGNENGA